MKTSIVALVLALAAVVCAPAVLGAGSDGDPAGSAIENAVTEQAPVSVMDLPMDGTSVEAFDASLERVKSGTSEGEYRQLKMALEWLLLYDIGARGDREALYRRLDGKSPNEIMATAKR
jgi:predicted small secreted protein